MRDARGFGKNPGGEWATTPKARRHPTARELAWSAGFLEGEGSFALSGSNPSAAVQAYQKQQEPLLRLREIFGGTVVARNYKQYSGWVWTAYGARARGIMLTLFTFMSPRRKNQIRVSLGYDAVTLKEVA